MLLDGSIYTPPLALAYLLLMLPQIQPCAIERVRI